MFRTGSPVLTTSILNLESAINDLALGLSIGATPIINSLTTSTPPATPVVNDCYVVPAGGSVAWGNPVGSILVWDGTSWLSFGVPAANAGYILYARGTPPIRYYWSGTAWVLWP